MSEPAPPDHAPSRPHSPTPLPVTATLAAAPLPSPITSVFAAPPTRPASRAPVRDFSHGEPASSCKCEAGGRNLIVCIDGTSNRFGEKNTNVVELYSRLVKDNDQLTFYNSGIGTFATPSWKSPGYYAQRFMSKLDLAFALRFEKIILSAYAWLADNYQPGDRIFLFGFSRGAYQVRVLSAMIHLLGLIHKGNGGQIPFAFELYAAGEDVPSDAPDDDSDTPAAEVRVTQPSADPPHPTEYVEPPGAEAHLPPHDSPPAVPGQPAQPSQPTAPDQPRQPTSPGGRQQPPLSLGAAGRELLRTIARALQIPTTTKKDVRAMQKKFRDAFARKVRVHFVGVWDTVSSVGLVRGKTLPCTTNGMGHSCFFRHALAIHEYRVKFLPEYANGGYGPLSAGPIREITPDKETAAGPIREITLNKETPAGPSRPRAKEVWFPGSHSDIGGGATDNTDLTKFGPSLRWMSFEARVAGARFEKEPQSYDVSYPAPTHSLKNAWWILEILPVKRLAYNTPEGTIRWIPHLGRSRVFQGDQRLSWDVSKEVKDKFGIGAMEVEKDPYTDAKTLVDLAESIGEGKDADLDQFRAFVQSMVPSVSGQQSLRGVDKDVASKLLKAAQKPVVVKDDISALVSSAIFGLAFAFDGTDSQKIGRSPQLAVRDFFLSLDRRISSATALDVGEKTMLEVLKGLHDGRVALRVDSDKAVRTIKRILLEIPDEDLDLFESVTSILAINGVACPEQAFNSNNRIIKPDLCDLIAVGCGLLPAIRRCTQTEQLLSPRDRAMLNFLRGTERYPGGPLVDAFNKRLSPPLLSLLRLCTAKCGPGESREAVTAKEMMDDIQKILDGFAFTMNYDTCEEQPLPVLLGLQSTDTHWTVPQIRGHEGPVTDVAFIHPGDKVASISGDNTVRLWDIYTGVEVEGPSMRHAGIVTCLAAASNRIVSASVDGVCIIWDSTFGNEISRSPPHSTGVCSVSISASGRKFAAGTRDGMIHILDMQDPSNGPRRLPRVHVRPLLSVAFSPGNDNILASSCAQFTRLWNLADGSQQQLPGAQHDWVRSVAFSPDGKYLASSSDDGVIHLWDVDDVQSPSLKHRISTDFDYIYSVAFSPNSRFLVSGSGDNAVRLWNVETKEVVGQPLWGHSGPVGSVVFSHDGSRIISGSADCTIRVWDRIPVQKPLVYNPE